MAAIWQHLEQVISHASERIFSITHRHSISGGDINQAFCLSNGQTQYFVKLNQTRYYDMFAQEVAGLAVLSRCKHLAVPQVICCGEFQQYSYLVLEFFDFAQRCDETSFGKALANLHLLTAKQFGFSQNNYIGRTTQLNQQMDDWGTFFTQCRLKPQLDRLRSKGNRAVWMNKLELSLNDICDFLNQHQPQPSLLHGDLWQGNYGSLSNGQPTVYDPAVYYGDSETDLAMMMLFGSPSENFYQSYQEVKNIDCGFEQRRVVYNLYHILNHANLFGVSYLHQAEHMTEQLLPWC